MGKKKKLVICTKGTRKMERSTPHRASLTDLYRDHHGKTSDKWESYLELYDKLFHAYRDRPVRLLEIGTQNGGSLDIWRKFFPNASLILGCDVNTDCGALRYDDERTALLIGNANEMETFKKVSEFSKEFDIIIDDGSHRSRDIIKSFALYFPILTNGGLYIAEDLHCSYWTEYEGGIEAPHSSISFFKRVSDLVNKEHWGADIRSSDCLSFYQDSLDIEFDDDSLDCVLDVSFRNSVVAVSKGNPQENKLGQRVVVGEKADVWPIVLELDGSNIESPDETKNAYGPASPRLEVAVAQRREAKKAYETVKEQRAEINRLNGNIESLANILKDARNRPLKQFKRLVIFKLQTFLANPSLPLPQDLKSRMADRAVMRNPDRSEF